MFGKSFGSRPGIVDREVRSETGAGQEKDYGDKLRLVKVSDLRTNPADTG